MTSNRLKIEHLISSEFWPLPDNPVAAKKWVIRSYCSVEYFRKVCNLLDVGTVDNGRYLILYKRCYS